MREPMPHQMEILLVEDNRGDVRLIREGLDHDGVRLHLNVAQDGLEALAFLRRQDPYSSAPRPDLIVLDLNLPRKSGREVLADMKADPVLSSIPVVVFSSSQAETDIAASYGLRANCYIVKPVDLDQFLAVVRAIEDFWLSVAALPSRPS
jgi:two-component system, chemotaxis family, response regulator Rcp1